MRNLAPEAIRAASRTIGVDARALEDPRRRLRMVEMRCALRQKHPGLRIMMRNCEYQELLSGVTDDGCVFADLFAVHDGVGGYGDVLSVGPGDIRNDGLGADGGNDRKRREIRSMNLALL